MKILVIDDSVEILNLLELFILKLRFDIEIEHYHPGKGIPDKKFNWYDYKLLILDYQLGLPDQDGFDWLDEIKLHKEVPPVLFMTSYGNEDIAIRAIKLGADDYLNKKNLSLERFSQRIKEILKIQDLDANDTTGQDNIAGFEQTVPLSAAHVQEILKSQDQNTGFEKTVPLSASHAKDIFKSQDQNTGDIREQDNIAGFDQTVPINTPHVREILKSQDQSTGIEQTMPLDNKKLISIKIDSMQKDLKSETNNKTGSASMDTKQAFEKKQTPASINRKSVTVSNFENNVKDHSGKMTESGLSVKNNDLCVPGYNIIRKIAQGGMASVYLAERSEDKLQVILKILNFIDDETEQLLKRFISEYRLVRKLSHPNIICVYERSFVSNFAYIAMEYCPAGDLSIRLDKALPPETAIFYMRQIANGIGAAHKVGIIHRDLKPGNILFRADDSIAIADFGIAKLQNAENYITKTGLSLGTILYISPEQICSETVGSYSDLYSLGIIFYKMLTGEYPFFGSSFEKILKAHLKSRVPRLPGELARFQPVIDGLLAKKPDERFQTAEDFIAELERGQAS